VEWSISLVVVVRFEVVLSSSSPSPLQAPARNASAVITTRIRRRMAAQLASAALRSRVTVWQCYRPMLSVTSSQDTTERILDAAYEELLHFGVKGVSVEDIAKRVGVARITIYRRWKTKDDLLGAVAMREGQRMFQHVDAAIEQHESLEDQLVEGFAIAFQTVRNHPLVKRVLSTEPELVASFINTQAERMVAMGREYLAARITTHRPNSDARPVAELIVRLATTFVLMPESIVKMRTVDDVRAFARRFLVPMVTTA
jgi:AcrR family transcriptional regulator